MRRVWDDVVGRKLYITGGIGSKHENEGFGDPYDLPNLTAYTEICAAISFGMWAIRMFRLTGEAQYIDVLERTLYNNVLAGVSLSGDRFFYACPPESDGTFAFNVGWLPQDDAGPYADASATRKPWFACACCPPNLSRWLEQVPSFAYATGPDGLYVNLYIAGEAELDIGGGPVRLRQNTRYPWDGRIRIEVEPLSGGEDGARFPIHLRIPGWARGHPVPSDLYRYDTQIDAHPTMTVNGKPQELGLAPNDDSGYVRLARRWRPGDVIELRLIMPVRRVRAQPKVAADRGKVALERGPIVYCAEGIDHAGRVLDLKLPSAAALRAEHKPNLLGGVTVLTGTAYRPSPGPAPTTHAIPFRAIPYAFWSHRGPGEMTVWLNR
jgi:hypothetical protein